VDPAQQRRYLINEMNEAHHEVAEWKGQQELLEIDAATFYKAADRLMKAYVSILKNFGLDRERQVELAKQAQSWGHTCTAYRDVFLPREQAKWKSVDVGTMEDNLFMELDALHRAILAVAR